MNTDYNPGAGTAIKHVHVVNFHYPLQHASWLELIVLKFYTFVFAKILDDFPFTKILHRINFQAFYVDYRIHSLNVHAPGAKIHKNQWKMNYFATFLMRKIKKLMKINLNFYMKNVAQYLYSSFTTINSYGPLLFHHFHGHLPRIKRGPLCEEKK